MFRQLRCIKKWVRAFILKACSWFCTSRWNSLLLSACSIQKKDQVRLICYKMSFLKKAILIIIRLHWLERRLWSRWRLSRRIRLKKRLRLRKKLMKWSTIWAWLKQESWKMTSIGFSFTSKFSSLMRFFQLIMLIMNLVRRLFRLLLSKKQRSII